MECFPIDVEPLQVLLRNINTASVQIEFDIGPEVGQLESGAGEVAVVTVSLFGSVKHL
jgi:hypothetical protein